MDVYYTCHMGNLDPKPVGVRLQVLDALQLNMPYRPWRSKVLLRAVSIFTYAPSQITTPVDMI